jgi:hypothetical protein
MANKNPDISGLRRGGGRPKKGDRTLLSMNTTEQTREALESIAVQYSCLYGGKPWIAGLLAKTGAGELLVVPAPPTPPSASSSQHS